MAPRSKAPPRRASRRRCSPPCRACSSASDALCRERPARPGLSTEPAPTPARPHLRRGLVKDHAVARTRTPSADEYPLPHTSASPTPGLPPFGFCRAPTASGRRLSSPRPLPFPRRGMGSRRIRHRAHDFAATSRLRAPYSPSRLPRLARPPALHQGRASSPAFLVDLCNQNSLRAQPRLARSPTDFADSTHPARAGLGASSRWGWGPIRRVDRRIVMTPSLPPVLVF